jgi:hypothetical protein
VIVLGISPGLAAATGRTAGPTKSLAAPQAGLIVQQANLAQLLDCLVGPGIFVQNPVMVGSPLAFGTFSGGAGIIGFPDGVILSSGDIANVVGPNVSDLISGANNLPGDPDLDALIPGFQTHDAASLEFDFTCDQSAVFSIEYVFASDEYNEFVNSIFNDVFGFFLDGNLPPNNIARVPSFCSSPGLPVTINNVNCNNPYAPPTGVNCDCYVNNDLQDGGGAINTEMDGLTHVFARTVVITPGTHHMKIAIADAGDYIYDSNVFLRCQSLKCAVSTETHGQTWGRLKMLYR